MSFNLENQKEFPITLFDTLFGMILFFSMDSFLDITELWHMVFYIFTTIVIVHWWLLVRSAFDAYEDVMSFTIYFIFVGVIEVIFLQFFTLKARIFDLENSLIFLLLLFGVNLIHLLIYNNIGEWPSNTEKKDSLRRDVELSLNTKLNLGLLIIHGLLVLLFDYLPIWAMVCTSALSYLYFAFRTMTHRIIDFEWY